MAPMSSSTGVKLIEGIVLGSAIFGTVFTVSRSYFDHVNARRAYEAPIREKVREKLSKTRANPVGVLQWYKVDYGWETVGNGPYGSKPIYAIEDLGRHGFRLRSASPKGVFNDFGIFASFDQAAKKANDLERTS